MNDFALYMVNYLFYLLYILLPIFAVLAPNILIAVLIVMALNDIYSNGWRPKLINHFIVLWAVFLTLATTSIFYAYEVNVTVNEVIKLVATMLCCYFSTQGLIHGRWQQNKLIKNFLTGWGIALFILIIEVISDGFLKLKVSQIMQSRLSSPIEFLNKAACVVSIGIWALLLAIRYVDCKGRHLYMATCYVMISILICSMKSETAIVGLLCGTIVLCITLRWPGFYKILSILVGVGLLLTPVILYIYMDYYLGALQRDIVYSWDHRLYIAFDAIYLIMQEPFLGWGLGASKALHAIDQGHMVIDEASSGAHALFNYHPHNNSLQVLLELGGVGLLVYSIACAGTIWFIGKSEVLKGVTKPYAYATFCAYLTIGTFNFNSWTSWFLSFILLSCVAITALNNSGSCES